MIARFSTAADCLLLWKSGITRSVTMLSAYSSGGAEIAHRG
jgi:hypothetical protein